MLPWIISLVIFGDGQVLRTPDIVSSIQSMGLRRVAICPQILSLDPVTKRESFTSSGPQGRRDSENLFRSLKEVATQFVLIDPNEVQKHFDKLNFSSADLMNEDRKKQLAKEINADSLIVIRNSGDSDGWLVDINILRNNNTVKGVPSRLLTPEWGLSDAAFSGKSFEVRRWVGEDLVPVGFQDDLSPSDSVGMGLEYELRQYAKLRKDRPHPLTDNSFPFKVAVRACGAQGENPELRDIEWIEGQPYIRLEPAEHFEIVLSNKSTHGTLMGLYVDGMNTIANKATHSFESPLQTPPNRRWAIDPMKDNARITGWTKIISGQPMQVLNRFKIAPKEESVAFGQSLASGFGTITAVIYTNGIQGIRPSPAAVPKDSFKGSGFYGVARENEAEEQKLTFASAQAGLMLASITLNYRTGSELEALRQPPPQVAIAKPTGNTSEVRDASDKRDDQAPDKKQVGDKPNRDAHKPTDDRMALVIGNSAYSDSHALANPGNDADSIEDSLNELGFKVTKKKDMNLDEMQDSILEFQRALPKGSLGLFYYAGHGLQVNGENFLVPIGARIREEFEVKRQCMNLGNVLEALDASNCNLKVLVLDCCSNNPFKSTWKNSRALGKEGLAAETNIPIGTLLAFSTAPGTVAADGDGKNSPYTLQLTAAFRQHPKNGLELKAAFMKAAQSLKKATGQTPWLSLDGSMDDYFLRR